MVIVSAKHPLCYPPPETGSTEEAQICNEGGYFHVQGGRRIGRFIISRRSKYHSAGYFKPNKKTTWNPCSIWSICSCAPKRTRTAVWVLKGSHPVH